MGLVLGLRKGHDFFVGDRRFVVERVRDETDFEIRDAETGAVHAISDGQKVEVMPKVFVTAGARNASSLARVSVEAPRTLRISRGEDSPRGRRAQPART